MTGKKQYYQLDEPGFIGTQGEKTEKQVSKDIEMTVAYIKAIKNSGTISSSQKRFSAGTKKQGTRQLI